MRVFGVGVMRSVLDWARSELKDTERGYFFGEDGTAKHAFKITLNPCGRVQLSLVGPNAECGHQEDRDSNAGRNILLRHLDKTMPV